MYHGFPDGSATTPPAAPPLRPFGAISYHGLMSLPHHLQSQLDRELDEGESIVWSAQPLPNALRRGAFANWLWTGLPVSFFVIIFGVLGWVATITPPAERQDQPWTFFAFVGTLSVFWLVSLPLFLVYARSTARSTVYAITDRRAIILVVRRGRTVSERDYRGDELIHLARTENPDGSGTLTFENARGSGAARNASRHRFLAIPDAIGVERILRTRFGDA